MLQSSNCSNEISPFKYFKALLMVRFILKFPGSALFLYVVAKQKLFSEKDGS